MDHFPTNDSQFPVKKEIHFCVFCVFFPVNWPDQCLDRHTGKEAKMRVSTSQLQQLTIFTTVLTGGGIGTMYYLQQSEYNELCVCESVWSWFFCEMWSCV